MALGVGYGWGRGVLFFNGRRTPFTVTGVTLVGVSADRLDRAAEIYNLKRLEDGSERHRQHQEERPRGACRRQQRRVSGFGGGPSLGGSPSLRWD
ncbi:MAG: hypothetical protein V4514_17790 [Pseudomonadota bacterium]